MIAVYISIVSKKQTPTWQNNPFNYFLSYSCTRMSGFRQCKTLARFVTVYENMAGGCQSTEKDSFIFIYGLNNPTYYRRRSVTNIIGDSTHQRPGHTCPPCSLADTHTCTRMTSSRWEHIFRTHRDCLYKLKKKKSQILNHLFHFCELFIPKILSFWTKSQDYRICKRQFSIIVSYSLQLCPYKTAI